MTLSYPWALALACAGCGGGGGRPVDAAVVVDGAGDAAVDAAVDAAPDAAVDAMADAALAPREEYVKASNTAAGAGFGAVAISGDGETIVVGAPFERGAATQVDGDQEDLGASAGAAYVFVHAGGAWSQQGYLKPFNTAAGMKFGAAVAISADGDTVAIGAPGENSAAPASGAIYVFQRTAGRWAAHGFLQAAHPDADDALGSAIAIDGDGTTIVAGTTSEDGGAPGAGGDETSNAAPGSGAAYVFVAAAEGGWTQDAYLKAANVRAGNAFGAAVAISADGALVVVGAEAEPSAATGVDGDPASTSAPSSGAAYVFARVGNAWTQTHYLKPRVTHADTRFGHALALSADGGTLAIGAFHDSYASFGHIAAGSVEVFRAAGRTWTSEALLVASNAEENDRFGVAVAIAGDGSGLVVTADGEDGNATGVDGSAQSNGATDSGAAYAFARTGATWSQTHYLKGLQVDAGDGMGAIALGGAGGLIAVGAPGEDGSATGIDGTPDEAAPDAGALYLIPPVGP